MDKHILHYMVFTLTLAYAYDRCTNITKIASEGTSDYYVTALLPIYNTAPSLFNLNGLILVELLKYMLHEFNQRSPYNVGYEVFDTCGENQLDITASAICDVILDNRAKPVGNRVVMPNTCSCRNILHSNYHLGIIGPASSAVSATTSRLVRGEGLFLVSYASTSPTLSNKIDYPNFMRTIPSDTYQAQVIADLISSFNWTYVSIIASDNAFGRAGSNALAQHLKTYGICVAFHILFRVPYDNDQIKRIVARIKTDKKAHVIVLFALASPTNMMVKHAGEFAMHNRTWIFTDASIEDGFLRAADERVTKGAFAIRPYTGEHPDFTRHFNNLNYSDAEANPFLKTFFNKNNINEGHSRNIILKDIVNYEYDKLGNARNAIMAYLVALQNFMTAKCGGSSCEMPPPITNREEFNKNFLKLVEFEGLANETVKFDERGDIEGATYLIQNVGSVSKTQVLRTIGKWQANKPLELQLQNIVWSTVTKPKFQCTDACLPGFYSLLDESKPCCWECLKCPNGLVKASHGFGNCSVCSEGSIPDALGIQCIHPKVISIGYLSVQGCTIFAASFIGSVTTLCVLSCFVAFRKEGVVKSGNIKLSILQLIFQLLLFLFILCFFLDNTDITCTAGVYITSLLLNIVLSVILVKTELLLRIFNAKTVINRSDARKITSLQCAITGGTTLLYVCAQILVYLKTPIERKELLDSRERTVVYFCDASLPLTLSVLHLLVMSLICGVQAYRARKLPDACTEGSAILYAVFTSSVLMFVLLLMTHLAKDVTKKKFFMYVLAFSINYVILIIMFSRKIWILWRKLRNHTDGHQTRRNTSSTFALTWKQVK